MASRIFRKRRNPASVLDGSIRWSCTTCSRTRRIASPLLSQDVFGRSQVSGPLTFSTAEPLTAVQQENSDNPPEGDDQPEMITSFKRRSGLYLLELTLKQPASVFIGSIERLGLPEDEFHTGLSNRAGKFHGGMSKLPRCPCAPGECLPNKTGNCYSSGISNLAGWPDNLRLMPCSA